MSRLPTHTEDQGHDQCPQCKAAIDGPIRFVSRAEFPTFCTECYLPLLIVAGKYRIERKLGEGGGGVVYLARHIHLSLNPMRVIKFINPKLLESDVALRRFNREIQVTSVLSQDNPYIVRVYDDFGVVAGLGHFYVMEYLDGADLGIVLEELPLLPREDVLEIIRQLCEAVGPAHKADIIHRDIKPSNIVLLRRDGGIRIKVTDFGLAKQLTGAKVTLASNRTIGTPLYMAPEQFEGSHHIDSRADIYAIATILYELLLGHNPFVPPDRENNMSLMELVKAKFDNAQLAARSHHAKRALSPRLAEILQKGLAFEPDARFSTTGELLSALQECKEEFVTSPEERAFLASYNASVAQKQAARPKTASLQDPKAFLSPFNPEQIPADTPDTASSTELDALHEAMLNQTVKSSTPDYELEAVPRVVSVDLDEQDEGLSEEEEEAPTIHEMPKLSFEDALDIVSQANQHNERQTMTEDVDQPELQALVRDLKQQTNKADKAPPRSIAVAMPRSPREGQRATRTFTPSDSSEQSPPSSPPSVVISDEMRPAETKRLPVLRPKPPVQAELTMIPPEPTQETHFLRNVLVFAVLSLSLILLFVLLR